MPFGKYRGALLCDLPAEYLDWLESIALREPLRSAIDRERERREHAQPQTYRYASTCPAPTIADELIGAGLHALTRKYHPDAGGAHDEMVTVNLTAEWLRRQVRALSPERSC